jgi:hypothetical protein
MDIATANWDEALQRFRTKVVSELEKRPGFLRTILTGDANAGKATAITMWQSAAHESPAQPDPVVEHMTGLVRGAPETSGYPELIEREF